MHPSSYEKSSFRRRQFFNELNSKISIDIRHHNFNYYKYLNICKYNTEIISHILSFNKESHVMNFLYLNGINVSNEYKYLLEKAANNGHLSSVKFLIKNHDDFLEYSDNALVRACTGNHLSIVKFLFRCNMPLRYGYDVLYNTALKGYLSIVKLFEHTENNELMDSIEFLIKYGANIENPDDAEYLLSLAIKSKRYSLIKYITKHYDIDYNIVLQNACAYGNFYLVRNFSEFIFSDDHKKLHLFTASQYGYLNIVKCLNKIHKYSKETLYEALNTAEKNRQSVIKDYFNSILSK